LQRSIWRDWTGWLAQQCRWHPALPVFPANREFYREFFKIAASGAPETVNSIVIAGLPMRIPYSSDQGIILVKQGILERDQGILSAGIEITPDEVFGTKSLG
jgi:hypothetical protein